MTDKTIISLINKLNQNKTQGLIHLRPLSPTVDFAKVWLKKPKPTDDIVRPDGALNFYFIKNENGIYVAGVLDMASDLHWVVLSKYRGNGHLTKAMKETILFHLFQDRGEQRITIDKYRIGNRNFDASLKVALTLGFIASTGKEYVLSGQEYQTDEIIEGDLTGITQGRLEELKKQINSLGISLRQIQSELEMKIGNTEYVESLGELVSEVCSQDWKLEDAWFDYKNRNGIP